MAIALAVLDRGCTETLYQQKSESLNRFPEVGDPKHILAAIIKVIGNVVYLYTFGGHALARDINDWDLSVIDFEYPHGCEFNFHRMYKGPDITRLSVKNEQVVVSVIKCFLDAINGPRSIEPDHIIKGLLAIHVDVRGWKVRQNYVTRGITFEVDQEHLSTLPVLEDFLSAVITKER